MKTISLPVENNFNLKKPLALVKTSLVDTGPNVNQAWVNYMMVLDSNTFLCSTDLTWCN